MQLSSWSPGRGLAVLGMLGVCVAHLVFLPTAFGLVAYLGVAILLAAGLALAGGCALAARDSVWTWWYVLAEGALNAAGYVVTRLWGLPLAHDQTKGEWLRPDAVVLGLLGAFVTVVAAWALLTHRAGPPVAKPVTSARERELISARRRWI